MTCLNTRVLPYFSDSERYMRALEEFDMPAFLDSACRGGEGGSLDLLMAAPVAFLKIENGAFSCSENAAKLVGSSTSSEEFLSYIRLLRDHFLAPTNERVDEPQRVDHAGTVAAYLGYPTLIGKADFAINDAFVGVYLWVIVIDHANETCELRMHSSSSADSLARTMRAIHGALGRLAESHPQSFRLTSPFNSETSFEEYEAAFDEIKSRIAVGDCYQVNLTQSFTARVEGSPLAAYLKLRHATQAPFSAYMDWNSGALLSASPERFLKVSGGTVLAQPIKGTRPRGVTEAEDRRNAQELTESSKDRAENLMIVDLLRNDLGRVCASGSIEVNQLFAIQTFSNVHHMVSDVSGELSVDRDALDLLESCYPGGSITGAPKLKAMEIIQQVERHPRRVYCGTVLLLGAQGNLDSNITIRSLLWQSGSLTCWAGGGIVADSECALEYQECFDKVNIIFSALQELP